MPPDALEPPLVILNYKVYPTALGNKAVELTKTLEDAASSYPEATVAICPSHPDLGPVVSSTNLPVLAQHTDGAQPGSGTGRILPESLVDLQLAGSLINHAERPVETKVIEATVTRLDQYGLASVVCAEDATVAAELAGFQPDFIAVEPPELIGGDVSVTSADPDIVSRSVTAVEDVAGDLPVLCGAGVKDGNDVAKALELGTVGVLVASGVVKAKDPGQALTDLLDGTREE